MRGGMRNPMPEQPADVRNKNFKEVALGYDMKTAVPALPETAVRKRLPC